MKIQQITPQYQQKNNQQQNNVKFTGLLDVGTAALRWLDTNQAWGANVVDLSFMVIPRTCVDFANRGPEAGFETGRREATGTTNHASIGLYGTAAGMALASMFNKEFGVKAHKIFANDDTVDILSRYWTDARKTGAEPKDCVKAYTDKIVENIKLFNTETDKLNGFVQLSKPTREKVSQALADEIVKNPKQTIDKNFSKYLHSLILADTGAETKAVLEGFSKQADNSLKTLLSNVCNVSKTFMSDKVDEVFKSAENVDVNKYVKGLKSLNLKRSLIGLAIGSAIGMSTQPINMYLTKKKTGSDGFVGVPGREKDKTNGFKLLKLGAAAAFAAMALSTITTKPSKLLSKLQFQGMIPTVAQLKLVYGLTIASRLLSARDKDELRESTVKDTLGFLNLLVLGTLVTKGVARLFNKSLINVTKDGSKNFFKWLTNSSLKTRDEVLYNALRDAGRSTVEDGKAIPFKELVKLADKATKKKLRILSIAQLAGYLYSGLVLGFGVPKLNIYMTNKSEAKRKAKLAAEGVKLENQADKSQMLKPENLAFLSQHM